MNNKDAKSMIKSIVKLQKKGINLEMPMPSKRSIYELKKCPKSSQ